MRSEAFNILEDIAELDKQLFIYVDDKKDKPTSANKMRDLLSNILDKYGYLEREDDK